MTIPVEAIHAKLEANGLKDLFNVQTIHPFGLVGSFLLSAKYPEIDFGDIDVQCHVDDAETVKAHLAALTKIDTPMAQVIVEGKEYIKIQSRFKYGRVDLVILCCEVLDNVREFDLTCCQNFYDGKQVHVLHPDHLESKTFEVGRLKHPGRIKLYVSRGFKEIEPTLDSNAPTPQPDPGDRHGDRHGDRSESPSKRSRSDTQVESELIDLAPAESDMDIVSSDAESPHIEAAESNQIAGDQAVSETAAESNQIASDETVSEAVSETAAESNQIASDEAVSESVSETATESIQIAGNEAGAEAVAETETEKKPKEGEMRQNVQPCHVEGCNIPTIKTDMYIQGEWKLAGIMKCTSHVNEKEAE